MQVERTGQQKSRCLRPCKQGDRHSGSMSAVLARRKPILLLRLSGVLLLRLATRTLAGLLFHEPPRITRLEPLARFTYGATKK